MGLANSPMVAPLPGGFVRVLRKSKGFCEKQAKIAEYELNIWELFLKSPLFLPQRGVLGSRLKIEIYTDAFDRSPFQTTFINWESGIGSGGILVINYIAVEFFSLAVDGKFTRG